MAFNEILSLLFFFTVSYGLGSFFTAKLNFERNYERYIMQTGFGIAVFAVLIALLGIIRIPLHWSIFLLLSLIGIFLEYKRGTKYSIQLKKSTFYFAGAIVVFIFAMTMYLTGAFSYDYLENDDSWAHAHGISYVKESMSILEPIKGRQILQYLDAYPPAYEGILGVINQISNSTKWTLKVYNSLFIGLSIIFLFFLTFALTKRNDIALWSSFFAAIIPAFFSHFIWSHTLALMFFPISLYALVKIREQKNFMYATSICGAAIFVTSIDEAIKFGLFMAIFFIIISLNGKKINKEILISGLLICIIAFVAWWGPMLYKYGSPEEVLKKGFIEGAGGATHPSIKIEPIGVLGSGTRQHGIYTWKEFLFASENNMINAPWGIGLVISILSIIGLVVLILSKEEIMTKYTIIAFFIFIKTIIF